MPITENILLRVAGETADAEQKVTGLSARLQQFGGQRAQAEADVSTDPAERKLTGLRARLTALRTMRPTIPVDVDTQRVGAALGRVVTQLGSMKSAAVISAAAIAPAMVFAATTVGGIGVAALATLGPIGLIATATKASLDKSTRAGKEFRREIDEIKKTFLSSLRPATQAVAGGVLSMLRNLASATTPLRGAFARLGASMGNVLRGLGTELASPAWQAFYRRVIGVATRAVPLLSNVLRNLLLVFRNVATAAMPLMEAGLNRLVMHFYRLAQSTSNIERLRASMQRGATALGHLWQIARGLGGVLKAVFRAGSGGADSFLASIARAVQGFARFLNSGRGQTALRQMFSQLSFFVEQLIGALPHLIGPLGTVLQVAGFIWQAVARMLALLARLGPVGEAVSALAIGFIALKGPLGVTSMLAGAFTGRLATMAAAQNLSTAAFVRQRIAMMASAVATRVAAAAQWLFNAAMRANPLMLIVTLIGAVVAAAMALGLRWRHIAAVLGAVWNAIKTAASAAFNFVKDTVVTVVSGVLNFIRGLVARFRAAGAAIFRAVGAGIKAVVGVVTGIVRWVIENIGAPVRRFIGRALDLGKRIVSAIGRGIKAAIDWVTGAIRWVIENIGGPVRRFVERALRLGKDIIGAIGKGIRAAVDWVKGAIRWVIDHIGRPVRRFIENAVGLGKDIINGIVRGLKAVGGKIKDLIINLAKDAWGAVKRFFGISSPSRLMFGAGVAVAEGLARGIQASGSVAVRAARSLAGAVSGVTATMGADLAAAVPASLGSQISAQVALPALPAGASGGTVVHRAGDTITAPVTVPGGGSPDARVTASLLSQALKDKGVGGLTG